MHAPGQGTKQARARAESMEYVFLSPGWRDPCLPGRSGGDHQKKTLKTMQKQAQKQAISKSVCTVLCTHMQTSLNLLNIPAGGVSSPGERGGETWQVWGKAGEVNSSKFFRLFI